MATTNKAFRVKTGLTVEGAELRPAQGTSSYPPILLTSGTNLGTPTQGAFEFDGTNFYLTATTGAGNRKTIAFTDLIPAAGTSTVLGTIKLFSDTTQSVAATAVSATASRTYGIQINASGQGVVNVPWTDTVYTSPLTLTSLTTGFSVAGGTTSKTLTVSETMTLTASGTGQTFTFPATTATIARTDAGQIFTGVNTLTSPSITTSLTTTSTSFDLLNTTATTLNIGAAATTLNLGASTGTLTIGNATITGTNATALNLNGATTITIAGSNATTGNLLNTTQTTLNIGGAATTMTIGNAATTAQTVNMFTAATAGGTYNIATAATSSGTKTINIGTGGGTGSTTTIAIGTTAGTTPTIALNGAVTLGTTGLVGPTTMGAFSTSTALTLGSTSAGTTTIQAGTTLNLNAPAVNSNATTLALFATPTTINLGAAATAVNIGAPTGTVTIAGNLTVNGITTTLNSNTLSIDDKNLELGSVVSGIISATGNVGTVVGSGPYTSILSGMSTTTGLIPGQTITATAGTGSFGSGTMTVLSILDNVSIGISSTATFSAGTVTNITGSAASDASADGGGITLKGTSDKTFQWATTGANWSSSENLSLATGKTFKINNADVISGSATALIVGNGASTTLALGANGGTATILNPTVTLTNATTLNIGGATQSIVGTTVAGTASIFNTNTGTVNLGQASSALVIGGASGGTITISGTGASTINIGNGSIGNTNTSTINIGTGGAGTGATQTVYIGNHAGSVGIYNTYIGATTTSSQTTIQGTTNLTSSNIFMPGIGTSGFVKLGASGQLSPDTNTYLQAAGPAITGIPTFNALGGIATVSFTTSGTTAAASAAIFPTASYNAAEIVIKAVNGTTFEIIKALVVIDSTGNVYNTQYADIQTGTQLIGTLDYTTTAGDFKISITPFAGTTGTTTYKAVLTLIAV